MIEGVMTALTPPRFEVVDPAGGSRAGRTLGIDVGATKIAACVLDGRRRLLARLAESLETPDEGRLVTVLLDVVAAARARFPRIETVGVGVAGVVTWPGGDIHFAANHAHGGLQLQQSLATLIGLPVAVDNDANAAARAELLAGSTDVSDALFLAVGTGLGSGLVVDGRLYRGRGGLGGEFGHGATETEGPRCGCGQNGCLELSTSAAALVRNVAQYRAEYPESELEPLGRGGTPDEVRRVIDAALRGDPLAARATADVGRCLGAAVASSMRMFNFELVVVGGGLSELGELLIGPMRRKCDECMEGSYLDSPFFRRSEYGQDAATIGAALLAADTRMGGESREGIAGE